jgi:hypothetical protein
MINGQDIFAVAGPNVVPVIETGRLKSLVGVGQSFGTEASI